MASGKTCFVSVTNARAARSRVSDWRRAAAGLTLAVLLLALSETLTHSSGLIAAIVLLAAALSSIAGFAFSPLAGALLFHVSLDNIEAIQIMLVASIALQAYSAWMLRSSIAIKDLWPYVVGGLATVPLGGLSPAAHTHVASHFGAWNVPMSLRQLYAFATALPFDLQTMSPGRSL